MSDLIEREDAIGALYKYSFVSKDVIEREINAIPSADRPQGEWMATEDFDEWYGLVYKCNICGSETIGGCYNYCPNCGADMREREGE